MRKLNYTDTTNGRIFWYWNKGTQIWVKIAFKPWANVS